MPQLLWDSSALIKRYAFESGNATVNALFAATPAIPMAAAYMVYAETSASLRRKLNGGILDPPTFTASRSMLEREILRNPGVGFITIEDADVLAGIVLTDKHNLNSTDAAILTAYLHYAQQQPANVSCVLVAADQRLLRAAEVEGLHTLNPELVAAADVPGFLAAL